MTYGPYDRHYAVFVGRGLRSDVFFSNVIARTEMIEYFFVDI